MDALFIFSYISKQMQENLEFLHDNLKKCLICPKREQLSITKYGLCTECYVVFLHTVLCYASLLCWLARMLPSHSLARLHQPGGGLRFPRLQRPRECRPQTVAHAENCECKERPLLFFQHCMAPVATVDKKTSSLLGKMPNAFSTTFRALGRR